MSLCARVDFDVDGHGVNARLYFSPLGASCDQAFDIFKMVGQWCKQYGVKFKTNVERREMRITGYPPDVADACLIFLKECINIVPEEHHVITQAQ